MVTTGTLCHGGPSEFATPDDEGIVEHASLFQIGDQCRSGLIDFLGGRCDRVFDSAVMVPSSVIELDKADASFRQSSGQ